MLADQSVRRFDSFVECHRDALLHGFAGSLEFGPPDHADTALPASIYGSLVPESGPGTGDS
jgi:hypothetical protein